MYQPGPKGDHIFYFVTCSSLDTILQEEFVVLQTDFVDCVYSLDIPGTFTMIVSKLCM